MFWIIGIAIYVALMIFVYFTLTLLTDMEVEMVILGTFFVPIGLFVFMLESVDLLREKQKGNK